MSSGCFGTESAMAFGSFRSSIAIRTCRAFNASTGSGGAIWSGIRTPLTRYNRHLRRRSRIGLGAVFRRRFPQGSAGSSPAVGTETNDLLPSLTVPKRDPSSVWISVDMEGIGGVAAYSPVMMSGPAYERARAWVTPGGHAPIEGAPSPGCAQLRANASAAHTRKPYT